MSLIEIEDVDLVGPHLLCIKDGAIVAESYRGNKGIQRAPFVRKDGDHYDWDEGVITSDAVDQAIAVGGKASAEFFHWMIEIVPRLTALVERGLSSDVNLLMRPAPRRYQRESLEALGLTPRFITEDVVRVRHLTFPSHTISYKGRGSISPQVAPLLRRFADHLGAKAAVNRRLYISRGDAPKRKILNEAALVDMLATHGFVEVRLAELTLEEQASLFLGAEVVVGLHGAGLSFCALSPPGLKVVELYPENFIAVSPFWNIASISGHDYAMVLCESVGNHQDGPHNSDVNVDVSLVESVLSSAFLQ
ncbi:MAG: glycosyltransferase family 61 protein [Alphaproteobacteria bacterium]|nr:MAG: glycosyltransferase family 61 protein [Alphaproteobacteria bacterium]